MSPPLGPVSTEAAPVGPRATERLWFDKEWAFDGTRPQVVNPLSDWSATPDFRRGEIYLRAVVLENPNRQPVWLELVLWSNGFGTPHACLACWRPTDLALPGTYTCRASPVAGENWHCQGPDALDFRRPFGPIQISAKLSNADGARITTPADLPAAYGFRARVTAVLVAHGSAFSGWSQYPAE